MQDATKVLDQNFSKSLLSFIKLGALNDNCE